MNGAGSKLGLVLSGGGARGAFEAGALQRLGEERVFAEPAIVAGTSAGAINAALMASGKRPEELRDFWYTLPEHLPARTNDAFITDVCTQLIRHSFDRPWRTLQALRRRLPYHHGRFATLAALCEVLLTDRFDVVQSFLQHVRSSHLANVDGLRARLIEVFGGETIPERRCALAINAVNARTSSAVRFVTARSEQTDDPEFVVVPEITVDMVLASVSIPILFPVVRTAKQLLWDGGVLNNTPLAPVVALGAERVVTILVAGHSPFDAVSFASLGQALGRLLDTLLDNSYNVDRRLLLTRNQLAEAGVRASSGRPYRKVTLYEAIRPADNPAFSAGSLLDFQRATLEQMYREGQNAASAWLRRGPREDGTHASSRDEPAGTGTQPAAPAAE